MPWPPVIPPFEKSFRPVRNYSAVGLISPLATRPCLINNLIQKRFLFRRGNGCQPTEYFFFITLQFTVAVR